MEQDIRDVESEKPNLRKLKEINVQILWGEGDNLRIKFLNTF